MNMIVRFKLLLTAIIWGGTFIAGRIVVREVEPFTAAFLRFALASIFLISITYKTGKHVKLVPPQQLGSIILLGITGIFAYNFFFFSGLKYISAGRASIIIATNPIFISLLSAYFFKEKMSLLKIVGIVLSVSGAILVISKGNPANLLSGKIGSGETFILLCVMSWVIYSLIGKMVMVNLSPLISVTYSIMIGTIALFFPAYVNGMLKFISSYSLPVWGSLFYLGFFGTVVGFLWYYQGIKNIGPMKASIFINFVPISALLLGNIFLKEHLTISLLIGAILVISGIIFTNISRFKYPKIRKSL
jgi:drug/metabolite transporter (DMT)-like permease